jgi:hypothetical protein
MPKTVMVAWPNQGWLHQNYVMYTAPMLVQDGRYRLRFVSSGHKCNENNYQHIAKMFWESDADFLLQFDDDNPPQVGKNPLDLVEKNLDVVAFPVPIWCYHSRENTGRPLRPVHWSVYKYMKESGRYLTMDPRAGMIEECDGTGAGCLLIAKRVFQSPLMRKEGWHRTWNKEDGTAKYGLDLSFSRRVKKLGFKIHVAWDYPCHHFKEIDILEIVDGTDQWMRTIPELVPYFKDTHENARLSGKSQAIILTGDNKNLAAGVLDRLNIHYEPGHQDIDAKRHSGHMARDDWAVSLGYIGQERIKQSRIWYVAPEHFVADYLLSLPGAKLVMTEIHPERIDGRPYMLFEVNGSPEDAVNALAKFVAVEPTKEAVEWLEAQMTSSK